MPVGFTRAPLPAQSFIEYVGGTVGGAESVRYFERVSCFEYKYTIQSMQVEIVRLVCGGWKGAPAHPGSMDCGGFVSAELKVNFGIYFTQTLNLALSIFPWHQHGSIFRLLLSTFKLLHKRTEASVILMPFSTTPTG